MKEIITCSQICITDSNGNIRFRISGDPVDQSYLELLDNRGLSLLSIGVRDDGNIFLRISDKGASGKGVYLGLPEGLPTISLNGSGATPVLNICLQEYLDGQEGVHFSVIRNGEVVIEEDI